MDKMKKYFRDNKKYLVFLSLVLLLGIFLRTYNFSSWIRFNDDQARDASRVKDYLTGTLPMPLLGPKAGSTEFKLGPIYYYFQYTTAFVFGNQPDKLAYPDLFFSILTIPLLWLFLKKYFTTKESFLLTAIFATSAYVVEYSRFAWNPNSQPFFALLFLYALLELIKPKQKKKTMWTIIAGITLGIGVQLHVLFLVIVPLLMIIFFIYAWRQKLLAGKKMALIILLALCVNIPQIYSEIKTHGQNTIQFFSGAADTSDRNSTIKNDVLGDGACHVRENAMMLSSFGNVSDNFIDCHLIGMKRQIVQQRKALGIWGVILAVAGFGLSIIFSLGGYLLFWYFIRREKDEEKKIFLGLLAGYAIINFAVMGILATAQLTSRYFLVVEFMPFILFGLWIKFIAQKFPKQGGKIISLLAILLIFFNLASIQKTFATYRGKNLSEVFAPESVNLEDQKFLANYLATHISDNKYIVIDDKSGDLFGEKKALEYFLPNVEIKQENIDPNNKFPVGVPFFSIDIAKFSPTEELDRVGLKNYSISDFARRGRFAIFEFKPNQ